MKNQTPQLRKKPAQRFGLYFTIGALFRISSTAFLFLFVLNPVHAQTTAFSYQGTLNVSGNPANGAYDLQFKLFDALEAGAQQGVTLTKSAVAVVNGQFAVSLDFGAGSFPGADRFLEIAAQPAGGGGFTTLAPRSQTLATPYAIRALNAGTAQTVTGPIIGNSSNPILTITNSAGRHFYRLKST